MTIYINKCISKYEILNLSVSNNVGFKLNNVFFYIDLPFATIVPGVLKINLF